MRVCGTALRNQRIVIFGAGTAGTGIADLIRDVIMSEGLSQEAACRRFWCVDTRGLITDDMGGELPEHHRGYARPAAEVKQWMHGARKNSIGLAEVVHEVRPTMLIGASGVGGAFTEAIVREMAWHTDRPIIFPLSNPAPLSEATPADLISWTDGRALIATGASFTPVTYKGITHVIGQLNNSMLYPGVGLGTIVSPRARHVSVGMPAAAAANALSSLVAVRLAGATLLPHIEDLRSVTVTVAIAVAEAAVQERLAGVELPDIVQQVQDAMCGSRAIEKSKHPKNLRRPSWKIIRLALLLAVGLPAAAQKPRSQQGPDSDAYRISVDVSLVVLQATVRDHSGHTVMELKRDAFTVFEDGKPQPIRLFRHEDSPVTIGLVIDHSSSMREKLADVTTAAQAFVQSSNTADQVFVVNFNEHVSLGLPAGVRFSDNAGQLGKAIGDAPALGTTALYDAIAVSLKRLQDSTHDKKVLIVISDGGDNASRTNLDLVLKLTEQSNAMIYTIGIFDPDDPDKNPGVLRRLAQESGGEAFFPDQLSETVAICQRIARDIRDQYTIGYSSTRVAADGTYHRVKLTASGKDGQKLSVRTRAGYKAQGPLDNGSATR